MSLPESSNRATNTTARNVSSPSSSPSKSSLRSPQFRSNPQSSSRSLLPSPHLAEPKHNRLATSRLTGSSNALEEHFEEHDEATQPDQEEEAQTVEDEQTVDEELSHNFQPLFTLLQDTQTSEYYHPTVHYVFADDDTDIITEAALRSLENSNGPEDEQSTQLEEEDVPVDRPPHSRVKEHYILVDLTLSSTKPPEPALGSEQHDQTSSNPPYPLITDPSGIAPKHPFMVTHASSLSPSLAILSAEITSAPTFESSSNSPVVTRNRSNSKRERQRSSSIAESTTQQQKSPMGGAPVPTTTTETIQSSEGLMLRIKCSSTPASEVQQMVTNDPSDPTTRQDFSTEHGDPRQQSEDRLESLMKTFENRLAEIRDLVDASDRLSGAALGEIDAGADTGTAVYGDIGEEGEGHIGEGIESG